MQSRSANPFVSAAQSYSRRLQHWIGEAASGYGVGAALAAVGALFLLASFGIGAVYAFRYIELRYGTDIAFASAAGSTFLLGIVFLVSGLGMIQRALRPVPRPSSELAMLNRELTNKATSIVPQIILASNRETKALMGVGVATFLLWLASPRRN